MRAALDIPLADPVHRIRTIYVQARVCIQGETSHRQKTKKDCETWSRATSVSGLSNAVCSDSVCNEHNYIKYNCINTGTARPNVRIR